ncbi:MAG TPA: hypothetical protein VF838_14025 [Trebonia sp.]
MSNETVISMRELEDETAELLPSRETLCCPCYNPCSPCGPSISVDIDIRLCL